MQRGDSFLFSQLFTLVGCNSGSNGNNENNIGGSLSIPHSQTARVVKYSNKLLGDPNDDDDLWVNITQDDASDEPGYLSIVANNTSKYNLKFIGCDDKNWISSSQMRDIPSGYRFPRTKNYDPKWKFMDGGDGIYDKSYISNGLSNSLHFSGTPKYSDGEDVNCYYSAYVPENNQSLYVKLVNHIYNACSDVETGCSLDKPHTDFNTTKDSNILQDAFQATPVDILAGYGSWVAFAKRVPGVEISSFVQEQIDSRMNSAINDLNLLYMEYKETYLKPELVSLREQRYNNFKLTAEKYGFDVMDDAHFAQYMPKPGAVSVNVFNYIPEQDKVVIAWQEFDMRGVVKKEFTSPASENTPLKVKANDFNVKSEMNRLAIQDNDTEAMQKLFARGKYSEGEFVDSKFNQDGELGQALDLSEIEEVPLELDLSSVALSGGVDLAFVAFQWFVLQTWMDGLSSPPAIGNFNTSLNHLSFQPITQDDAINWNASHDKDHQILANTNVTYITKNSVFHLARFNFTDPNLDDQLNLQIGLSALTTPWLRYDENDNPRNMQDPYLGFVGDSSDHKMDAVVELTISDNNLSPTKDLDNEYNQSQIDYMGLSNLIPDLNLPAPEYTLSNIKNRKNGNIVFQGGEGIKSNLKGGAFDGALALNNNQEANLTVFLPSNINSKQTLINGGGFSVRYVDNPADTSLESQITNPLIIKSDELRSSFDSLESATPHYLYAKFNCKFPNPVGIKCPLSLSLGGYSDSANQAIRSKGKLYISDLNSHTTAIPVYLNYNLISEPQAFTYTQGTPGVYRLSLMNAGLERYVSVQINGLPQGTKIVSNSCNNGLSKGEQCQVDLDFSNVTTNGNYIATLTGIRNNYQGSTISGVSSLDTEQLTINVTGGW